MNTNLHSYDSNLVMIGKKWRALYFATIGAVAGFLGSIIILAADIVFARFLGYAPFMLLRYYATIREGSTALLMSDRTFFLSAFLMHLAVGSAFGAIFVLILSRWAEKFRFTQYLASGVAFGLAIWIMNFYLLLSWIQPLINGKAYILDNIPWWVAALTHALYGLTVALVSYTFRNDVEND